MSKMIDESCKDWKLVMSLPDIPGITDSDEELDKIKRMLHATGDVVAVLGHLPEEKLRVDALNTFLAIASRTQMEMDDSLNHLIDVFVWRLKGSAKFSDEALFGLPLQDALFGCLKTKEEKRLVTEAYPDPDIWNDDDEDDGDEPEEDKEDDDDNPFDYY
ncbi:MAG: hypothetical protein KOO63_02990 [Bacteroidales bacterium]|nr:hypothetical protein [Candidatus Latescibacterota bacterium]